MTSFHIAPTPPRNTAEKELQARRGMFKLTMDNFRDASPARVNAIMAQCVLTRREHLAAEDCVQYVAVSPLFDELQNGEIIPHYTFTAEPDGAGGYTVTAVRKA
jgi:hypothetical protein